MAKKPPPFNNPFVTHKEALVTALTDKKTTDPKPPSPSKPQVQEEPGREETPDPIDAEGELFKQAMLGSSPLTPDPRGLVESKTPTDGPRRTMTEAEEVTEALVRLVQGETYFDISESDEFIMGAVCGLDQRILRRLRRGAYSFKSYLDLHGMNRETAKDSVDRFIHEKRREGERCVLIVHGRGLNSKDNVPVLKQQLRSWLERGRIARNVLAFCTARPNDGGRGAVYVLLRR